mmetsp:Transcript_8466/g.22286  ORF Transcript_8466/g.22286 Transcript_8466/m.22286 type:complete len:271 (-) Transcript_8466:49-861(-)
MNRKHIDTSVTQMMLAVRNGPSIATSAKAMPRNTNDAHSRKPGRRIHDPRCAANKLTCETGVVDTPRKIIAAMMTAAMPDTKESVTKSRMEKYHPGPSDLTSTTCSSDSEKPAMSEPASTKSSPTLDSATCSSLGCACSNSAESFSEWNPLARCLQNGAENHFTRLSSPTFFLCASRTTPSASSCSPSRPPYAEPFPELAVAADITVVAAPPSSSCSITSALTAFSAFTNTHTRARTSRPQRSPRESLQRSLLQTPQQILPTAFRFDRRR